MSADLKFFPGENLERESLSMLCCICMGFSLTAFRKVRKPFHYSRWFFFFSTWANGQFHHLRLSTTNKEGTVWGRIVMRRQGESPRAGVDFQHSNNGQKKSSELASLQSSLNSLIEKLWPAFTNQKLYCLQGVQHLLHLAPKSLLYSDGLNLIFAGTPSEIQHWLLWGK